MDHHEDRAPLMLKIAFRQSLRRIQAEEDYLSQYEELADNLGWKEVAVRAAAARKSLVEAAEMVASGVEAAVKIQAEAVQAHAHAHGHEHEHLHTHTHSHPHDHPHDHDHIEGQGDSKG